VYAASFSELTILYAIAMAWCWWLRPKVVLARYLPPVLTMLMLFALFLAGGAVQSEDAGRLLNIQRAMFGGLLMMLLGLVGLTVNARNATPESEGTSDSETEGS